MAVTVPPVPHKTPLADRNGYLSPAWSAWFRELFLRVGGTIAPSNTELALVSDPSTLTRLTSAESAIAALQSLTTSQGVAITTLRNDLEQGPEL